MNEGYRRQVELLIRVMPLVFKEQSLRAYSTRNVNVRAQMCARFLPLAQSHGEPCD